MQRLRRHERAHLVEGVGAPAREERLHGVEFRFQERGEEPEAKRLRERRVDSVEHRIGAVHVDPGCPGRRIDLASRFDTGFAQAANAIPAVGGHSGVVKSPFGYHVILLLERVEAQHYELSRLRSVLEPDVYERRSGKLLSELLTRLERETPVERARNIDELTASLARGR